ncbi:uncharacterized protein TNCV_2948581 [Trichonephila clavipes]|nr:uncharacterized protein TNCV_2948581 [Trichonephila clavipes]
MGVKGTTHNGPPLHVIGPKCPSARRLRMVREDIGALSEGPTCAWTVDDETVGCTRTFLTMWRTSGRLVCRVCPELGLHVNDISRIHCF